MSKVILYFYLVYLTMDSYCWITDINFKMLSEDENNNEISSADERDGVSPVDDRGILIFPGTKWCGPGTSADNYDDLGTEVETDKCCRAHDYCPDIIPGGGTLYNLTNKAFYTRLNCACDYKFYGCLQAAKTKTATYIGSIYFNTIQTKCFRKDYPVTNCAMKGGWFKTKCLKYNFDTSGKKIYQWFDVPEF